MLRRSLIAGVALLVLLSVASCAAGPNELVGTAGPDGTVAGFWLGLWHGFISLISFIVSIFRDDVSVYEVHNNGLRYNVGFVLGAMVFFGGSGGRANRRSKHGPREDRSDI